MFWAAVNAVLWLAGQSSLRQVRYFGIFSCSLFPRMKTLTIVLALLYFGLASVPAQTMTATKPLDADYAIKERGANHRVWQRTTYEQGPNGQSIAHVHSYTELAAGLHYKDASTGQWLESQELIESFVGGAVARQGPQQVIFANNLNSAGAIDLQTPDGRRLRSNILGLMYVDTVTGDAVMIARLQDSLGQLISANQVLYTNAFQGVQADVRYTYKKSSFEQDVILREQPPTPDSFGLNPDTTVLEVVTEFINPPPANVTEQGGPTDDQTDETIAWGATSIGRGKAFDLADEVGIRSRISVKKKYVNIQGRHFLIERLQVKSIRQQLNSLPAQASIRSSLPTMVSKQLVFPKAPLAQTDIKPMRLALSTPANKGYVLDYVTINLAQTNFVFQGDMTYYVSGEYNLSGTTTIEGGTVIKLNSSGQIDIDQNGALVCKTGPYRPAIFTSYNDNSVGEVVSGSSGTPDYNDVLAAIKICPTNVLLHDLRFSYASYPVLNGSSDWTSLIDIWNCQFQNVDWAIIGNSLKLHNVLIARSAAIADPAVTCAGPVFVAENVTADSGYAFLEPDYYAVTMAFTNCLITGQPLIVPGYPQIPLTNSTVVLLSPTSPVYQVVGGGNYYLTNDSPYRDIGTTSINPTLLAALGTKTTYPPLIYTSTDFTTNTTLSPQAPRDTDVPDLGYHYDPLDYAFGGVVLTTNLTVSAGTVVGWFQEFGSTYTSGQPYGICLNDYASVMFNGTAIQPCWFVAHSMVQELGNGNWAKSGWMSGITLNGSSVAFQPQIAGNFAKFSTPANLSCMRDNWDYGVAYFSNCEFFNAGAASYAPSIYWTNCLFFRTWISFWSQTASGSFTFQNCTYNEGMLAVCRGYWQDPDTNTIWRVKNTAFNGTGFNWYDCFNGDTNYTEFDYNSYNTNNLNWQSYPFPYPPVYGILETAGAHNVMTTNFNWQSSWLGDFYLPDNSPLINAGSTTADQIGLYHFTTQTDQIKEANSAVDIGYHYVAVDGSGNPLDNNADGLVDYQQDDNGNGLVDGSEAPWLASPTISSHPFSQVVALSSNVIFNVTASGISLNYQWYSNSVPIPNATSATLGLNSVQTNCAGNYYVNVSNPAGSTTSATATLTVIVPPSIVTQPQPASVNTIQGTTAGFSITVAGTSPFSYQWLFNGTNPVSGATGPVLTLASVSATNAGNYSVVVSNLAGGVTSSTATLTVALPSLSWLQQYFGLGYLNNTNAANAADPDGDGVSNLQEYSNDSNPIDYYNGILPSLSIISGNNQAGQLNAFLSQQLVVQVLRSGLPLTNAPVTFVVTNGVNLLAVSTNGSPFVPSLSLQTDSNGYAKAWLYLPANSPVNVGVIAAAQSGTNAIQSTFSASADTVSTPAITPNGGSFVIIQNAIVSCSTTGAVMYYTLNGKIPTQADQLATNNQVILIQGGCVLKVRAFKDGVLWPSTVASATFNIPGAIAAGYNHTLALKYDGSVWAAGANGNGRLGDGTTNSRVTLVSVTNLPTQIISIEAGGGHSLALNLDGTVRAWGLNSNGQLGISNLVNQLTNVMVMNLSNVVAIAAGGSNSLALLSDGTVRAWGDNSKGQLGDNTTTDRSVNIVVTNLAGVVAIAAGGQHCLALQSNGTVRAWGANGNGQLGDNTTASPRKMNVGVSNLTSVIAIAAGLQHSMALLSDRTVRAWGDNSNGQLGDGTTTDRKSNIAVTGLSNVVAIAAGSLHSLALLTDGSVRAWGDNATGQLGDGTTTDRHTNIVVIGVSNVVAIAAGANHSLALRSDGAIYIWGYTNYGLSGGFSSTPVIIQPTNHLTYWVAPLIVNQPQSQSGILGGTASFEVGATGTMPMNYQWYSNSVPISSATNSTLTLNNLPTNAAAGYSVAINNAVGSTTSVTAVLTVSIPQVVIITQPTNQAVLAGSTVLMTVAASGALPLNYQWYASKTGMILGATNSFLIFYNVQTNSTDLYYVAVGDNYGSSVSSSTASLMVIDSTTDSDGDGLPDPWELKYFGHTGVNLNADPDGDYLSNLQEYQYGTNPNNADTDGDGRTDWQEIIDGTDPLNLVSYPTWPMVAYQPGASQSGGFHPNGAGLPNITSTTVNGVKVYYVINGVAGVRYNIFGKPTLFDPWTWVCSAQTVDMNGKVIYYNVIIPGMDTYYYTLALQSELNIVAQDATASEVGPDTGAYRITRTGGDQTGSLVVNFQTPGGSATAGDYAALPTFVTIPANVDHVDVTLTPTLNANSGANNKTVVLTLDPNNNHNCAIGVAYQATINIIDAYGDTDGDGLADAMEAVFGCNPQTVNLGWKQDSDNDGVPDTVDATPNSADAAPILPAYNKCPL